MIRAALISTFALLPACDRLPFLVSAEESATKACEQRLKTDLKSPSSYKRLWSTFTPGDPVTKADMMEMWEADRKQAAKEGNDAEALADAMILRCMKNPKRADCAEITKTTETALQRDTAFVLIEYEAANAFNARLPGFFSCRVYVDDRGKYADGGVFTSTTVPDQIGRQMKTQAEFIKNAGH
jgi:hypothetical protein